MGVEASEGRCLVVIQWGSLYPWEKICLGPSRPQSWDKEIQRDLHHPARARVLSTG